MNHEAEKRQVIFSHSGGPRAVIAKIAADLREAFPTCDVLEIENPPPCVRCGLPAVCQVDGADLCPKCGEVKIEPVVSEPANIIDPLPGEPKYANRHTRRHADDWFAYDADTSRQIRGCATPAGRNDPCPCGSGRKFKRCHGGPAAAAA